MVVCNDSLINCSDFSEVKVFLNTLEEFQHDSIHPEIQAYPFKLYWVALFSLCVAFGLIAFGYSVYVIRKNLFLPHISRSNSHVFFWAIFAVALALTFLAVGVPSGKDIPHTWRLLSPVLLREDGYFPDITFLKPFVDGLSIFVSIFVAAAVSMVLLTIQSKRIKNSRQLLMQVDYFKYLIYLGAILLILNVLRLHSLLNWSYALLVPEFWIDDLTNIEQQSYKSIENIIYAIVFIQGLMYSLMLFALYTPSKLIIKGTISAFVKEVGTAESDSETNISLKNANSFSIGENVTNYLAIIGPLMAGPVAEFLKNVLAGL